VRPPSICWAVVMCRPEAGRYLLSHTVSISAESLLLRSILKLFYFALPDWLWLCASPGVYFWDAPPVFRISPVTTCMTLYVSRLYLTVSLVSRVSVSLYLYRFYI